MKQILLTFIIMIFICTTSLAQDGETAQQTEEAIRATVMNYIEGWYEGNPERMEKALHPDLAKRGVQVLPATGTTILNFASARNMVEYTRAGFGKLPAEERNIKLTIFDVYKTTASVKVTSAKFIDYAHLVKCDRKWLIVNVLWEPLPKEKE